ncbi:MAG: hypothetical protein Q7J12_04155 [Syntrophales bacterium]|nr:hypothetical protein [Syntrophales bacterium]
MEEHLRKELAQKLVAIRQLGDEVRKTAGLPCIESYMRFVDINCTSALWHLGETDYWEYELR